MKLLFIAINILFFYSILYSQEIKYVTVRPYYNSEITDENNEFDNISAFKFFINTIESYKYKKCDINFDVDEVGGYVIFAVTGSNNEYTEDVKYYKITSMDEAFCQLSISTLNLPYLEILIGYRGNKRDIVINNVTINFWDKKNRH